MPRSACWPVLLLSSAWPSLLLADEVVYDQTFNAKPGTRYPEWSSSKIEYAGRSRPPGSGSREPQIIANVESPRGGRRFLGEFGGPKLDPTAQTRVRQTVALRLGDLPPHAKVAVAFDLLILRSWDGNSPAYGPDRWSLKVAGGPTLLDTTFSNNPKLQTDRSDQNYPRPGSRPQSGAASAMTLGYGYFGDSVYPFRFEFPHKADRLVLEFSSDLFEGKGTEDESWGLDNVRVSLIAPPNHAPAPRRPPP